MAMYSLRKIPVGGGSGESSHPFKVTTRVTSDRGYEAMVEENSSLMKSLKPNDRQVITGLGIWFTLIPNDVIWLGIVFTPGTTTIVSASIDSYGQGDTFVVSANAWSGNNSYCESDGGSPALHQTTRVMIAYTLAGDDGSPTLYQTAYNHLLIRSACVDLRAATVALPAPYAPYVVV